MLKEAGLMAITVIGLVTKLEAEACWPGETWAGGGSGRFGRRQ